MGSAIDLFPSGLDSRVGDGIDHTKSIAEVLRGDSLRIERDFSAAFRRVRAGLEGNTTHRHER